MNKKKYLCWLKGKTYSHIIAGPSIPPSLYKGGYSWRRTNALNTQLTFFWKVWCLIMLCHYVVCRY